ncbi:MAG: endonuclease domain-containing protein [Thermomicrobiales bacterium]
MPAARMLRERETPAERILWDALRGRRLAGLKFRRQHPIGPFVADFCCPDRRLIVELDGEIHATQHDRDAEREALLNAAGYRVVRFTNHELLADLPRVLTIIQRAAEALPQRTADPIARTHGW